jgi:fructose-1,6-bisphosphatase I
MYECNPVAYIVEKAGGLASTGSMRVLDIQPKDIHERAPIFIGSRDDVQDVIDIYKKHAEKQQSK